MLKNIRIRTLLSVSFVLLCLLLIVVGGLGIYSLQQSNGNVVLLYQDRLVPIKLLGDINKNFLNIRGNILLMLYEQSSEQFEARNKEVTAWVQENNKNIDLYDKTAMSQDERTIWAVFKNALSEYSEKQGSLLKSIEERDFTLAMIRSNDFFTAQDSAAKAINDIIAYNQTNAEALQNEVQSNFHKTLILIFVIVAASILLAIALLFFVPRRINKPIDEMVNAAKRVAKGDVNTVIHWHSDNEMGTLAASFAEVIKNLQNLVNQTKQLTDASSNGNFDVRADATAFEGGFKDILDGVNNTLDTVVEKAHWYESLLDSIPEFIMAIDSQMNLTFVNRAYATHKSSTREEMIGKPCNSINSVICANEDCAYKRLQNDVPQITFENNGKYFTNLASYLKDKNGDVIGHVELGRNVTQENRKLLYQKTEVNRLAKNLGLLAQGNLDLDLAVAEADEYTQEDYENFAKINDTFQATKDSLQYYIGEIAAKLESIAQGDINVEVTSEFKGEFNQIKDSLSKIVDSLNEMLHQINQSSSQVLSGASQVASAAQSLSQGSTEQASSIEELSATIEDISGQIKKNAENSKNAKGLAANASDALDQAQKQMNNMVAAMVDINDSSNKISKIIKTIDEIAFQTNILALNAAVEAARAGEAGKGFAVVADEVRNLASKSAEAAKDTALLIENSIQAVEKGSQSANATAAKLVEVIAAAKKSGELVSMISDASAEQAQAIMQTTQGVTQISRVVQTNSATAEESAAASEELSGQANMLSQLISRFNLRSSSSGMSHESFFVEPKTASPTPRLDLPHDSKY